MTHTLIVGYGNPLRGDDAFGYQAAARLRERLHDPEVEVLMVHQLAPELMEAVSRAEKVVFIDARAEGKPGELVRETVLPAREASAEAFTHHLTPQTLLAGARAVYGRAPEAVLYSAAGESFEFGEGLSRGMAAALDSVVLTLAHGA